MKFGSYEIRTDSCSRILNVWRDCRNKDGYLTGHRKCEDLDYSPLRDMAWPPAG